MAQMVETGKMHTMLEACEQAGLTYQALKFYCNEGLVPGVRRDSRNRRVFDDRALAWVKDLACLKRCGFGIAEMKGYLALCLEGESTIPERKAMLDGKRAELVARIAELECSWVNGERRTRPLFIQEHALYGGHIGEFDIKTFEMMEGE